MAYIGNTNTTQAFTPAIDYFSGNGSTTAFTLSRPVASVAQVQVVVNNVTQNPGSAFSVLGQTITFTGAPSSGTNNIYVYYTSPITNVISVGQGTVGLTQLSASGTPSSSNYLRGDNTWATVSGYAGPTFQKFTSSGTFTVPTGITKLKVTTVGGGGGSASSDTGITRTGGTGGTTSFGAYTSATGGGGGSARAACGCTPGASSQGGSGSGTGDVRYPGYSIYAYGGGYDAGYGSTAGSGIGGPGGTAVKWITGLTPGSTVTVTIGAGGTGGGNTPNGPGVAGLCIVEW